MLGETRDRSWVSLGAGAPFSLIRCYNGGRGEVRVVRRVGRRPAAGTDHTCLDTGAYCCACFTHTEEPAWLGMGWGGSGWGMVLSKHKGASACSHLSSPAHRVFGWSNDMGCLPLAVVGAVKGRQGRINGPGSELRVSLGGSMSR